MKLERRNVIPKLYAIAALAAMLLGATLLLDSAVKVTARDVARGESSLPNEWLVDAT